MRFRPPSRRASWWWWSQSVHNTANKLHRCRRIPVVVILIGVFVVTIASVQTLDAEDIDVVASTLWMRSKYDDPSSLSETPQHFSIFAEELNRLAPEYDEPSCPEGLRYRSNHNMHLLLDASSWVGGIPKIVHQTSKSRCLTPKVYKATEQWQSAQHNGWDGYVYILHDDAALQRLFAQEYNDIPFRQELVQHCLTTGTLQADVWRYIVLFRYGGIYADIDAVPNRLVPSQHLQASRNTAAVDALMVVEQYHIASQWFMAMSPQHPLMWYAHHQALQNLLEVSNLGRIRVAHVTGPHALHQAFQRFVQENPDSDHSITLAPLGPGQKPVKAGVYRGNSGRTVTILGRGEQQNEYVNRDVLRRSKFREYEKMHMQHFSQELVPTNTTSSRTVMSCRQAIAWAATTSRNDRNASRIRRDIKLQTNQ